MFACLARNNVTLAFCAVTNHYLFSTVYLFSQFHFNISSRPLGVNYRSSQIVEKLKLDGSEEVCEAEIYCDIKKY